MKTRLQKLCKQISSGLIERDDPVKLALLSALAGEHLLLIGLPGTAKSVMARRLHQAFRGSRYFERLLTRFSVPEELFGPLSIKALEDDRYERQTDHYLPTASIAFIDEVFKANSAILNALLTLLNEREFDNGAQRLKTPLISVVAASNELPQEEELQALYDRFLCRYQVMPVSKDQFVDLLLLEDSDCLIDATIALDPVEIDEIQQGAVGVALPDDVIRLLQALRDFVVEQGIYISDRRWRKAIKLLRVSAFTNDQEAVSIWDCALLQHCLWNEPDERAVISQWYKTHIGIGSGFNAARLEKLVSAWESALRDDLESQTQLRNSRNELLYLDENQQTTTVRKTRKIQERDGEPLYLAPPDQPDRTNNGAGYTADELGKQFFDEVYGQCHINGEWQTLDRYVANGGNRLVEYGENRPAMEPTLHEPGFVQSRIEETGALLQEVEQLKRRLDEQLISLAETSAEHLWVEPAFIEASRRYLEDNVQQVEHFVARLQQINARYHQLPTHEPA